MCARRGWSRSVHDHMCISRRVFAIQLTSAISIPTCFGRMGLAKCRVFGQGRPWRRDGSLPPSHVGDDHHPQPKLKLTEIRPSSVMLIGTSCRRYPYRVKGRFVRLADQPRLGKFASNQRDTGTRDADLLLRHQDFAFADMVGRADDALIFHLLDQSRGLVIADGKLALDVGGRAFAILEHDGDRRIV